MDREASVLESFPVSFQLSNIGVWYQRWWISGVYKTWDGIKLNVVRWPLIDVSKVLMRVSSYFT
jgi:hypothetical protein